MENPIEKMRNDGAKRLKEMTSVERVLLADLGKLVCEELSKGKNITLQSLEETIAAKLDAYSALRYPESEYGFQSLLSIRDHLRKLPKRAK